MAQIPVEKKSSSSWWMWLIGLLALLVIGWFVWQNLNPDREGLDTTTPGAVTGSAETTPTPTTGTMGTPAGTTGADTAAPTDTPASAPAGTAPGELVTDVAAYASTSDKLSLVGREVVLSSSRVARVVGPKSFTLTSGSEELLVLIDQDLSRGVGTQGQIDPGNTINLKGNFQRIEPDEIDNIASNRFRDLTEPEREWLRKTEVYLHATEFSKIN